MNNLKTWVELKENNSRDFYKNFDETIFPETISFKIDKRTLRYNLTEVIPQSNKVTLLYDKKIQKKTNPYMGNEPPQVVCEIDITYPFEEEPKINVTLKGGGNDWIFFEYQNKEVIKLSTNFDDVALIGGSKKSLISALNKLV